MLRDASVHHQEAAHLGETQDLCLLCPLVHGPFAFWYTQCNPLCLLTREGGTTWQLQVTFPSPVSGIPGQVLLIC